MHRFADDVATLDVATAGYYAKILATLLTTRTGAVSEQDVITGLSIPAESWPALRSSLAPLFTITDQHWSHPIAQAFRLLAGDTSTAERDRRRRRSRRHASLTRWLIAAGVEPDAANAHVGQWLADHDHETVAAAIDEALSFRRPNPLGAIATHLAKPDHPTIPDVRDARYGRTPALRAVTGRMARP